MPDRVADTPRAVTWLNRGEDVRAYLWHRMAPGARALLIDELGARHCAIRLELPARAAVRADLPDAVRFLDDWPTGTGLNRALGLLVAQAVGPSVLAIGRIDHGERWDVILRRLDPDILCLPPDLPPPPGFGLELAAPLRLGVRPQWRGLAAAWLAGVSPRRHGPVRHAAADVLAPVGFAAPEREGDQLIRRATAGRRGVLLLPALDGPCVLSIDFAGEVPALRLRVDRREVHLHREGSSVRVAVAPAGGEFYHLEFCRLDGAAWALERIHLRRAS